MEYFEHVTCTYFFLFLFFVYIYIYIYKKKKKKKKWRLHTTYPKRKVPLKAPKSLFWGHPDFGGLSHIVYQKLPELEKHLVSLNSGDKNVVKTAIEVTPYVSSISITLYNLSNSVCHLTLVGAYFVPTHFSIHNKNFSSTIRIFLHSITKLFCYCFIYWTLELENDQNDTWKKKFK